MIETTKLNEIALAIVAKIDRDNADAKLNEILDCCIDYKRAVKRDSTSKFKELREQYHSHFSAAKKYAQSKTLGASDLVAIERFYADFAAFHRENVSQFLREFYCLADKGLKTRKILNDWSNGSTSAESDNLRGIAQRRELNLVWNLDLDNILKKCADYSQKLDKHWSNNAFAALESAYADFSARAMECKKTTLLYDIAQLCSDFGVFHHEVMDTHWNVYVDDFR